MGLFNLFKDTKEKTLLDEVHESTVKLFRTIGEANDTSPSKKMSDKLILEIATEVMSAFKNASQVKNERIPGGYLMSIAMKFFVVYEQFGKLFYKKHLEYELQNYLENGLREDYKFNLLQIGDER